MTRARDVADKNLAVISAGNSGQILTSDGTNWSAQNAGLTELSEDTTPALGGDLTMGSNSIADGVLGIKNTGTRSELRMYCEVNNAHYVALKAPAHANYSGNPTFTLPPNTGSSGQLLKTDGAGAMSWGDAAAGGNVVEAVASGTIANGDTVILNSDGTVSAITGAAGGEFSEVTMSNNASTIMKTKGTFHSVENKVVVVCQSANSGNYDGVIMAATISGDTLTFGSPHVFNSNYTNECDVAYDVSANHLVVIYEDTTSQYGTVKAFSLSGTTFTETQSALRINSTNSARSVRIQYDPDNDCTVQFCGNISSSNYGQARAIFCTSNGLLGVQGVTTFSGSHGVEKIKTIYNTTNNHHLIVYENLNNSNFSHYAVVEVSGTQALTRTSGTQLFASGWEQSDIAYDPNQNIVAFSGQYAGNGSYQGYIVLLTPSGTYTYTNTGAPSGTANRFTTNPPSETASWTRMMYNPDTQKFNVFWYGNNGTTIINPIRGAQFTVDTSTNAITFETAITLSTTSGVHYINPVYDTNSDRMFIAYQDQTDGNRGHAGIYKFPSTTLTTSNFLGFSDGAYTNGQTATIQTTGNTDDAQTGLTINTVYYVQSDGSLGTSPSGLANVKAGKAISATKILIADVT